MPELRRSTSTSVDVLDHILTGMVIDARTRLGCRIDLLTVEARVVVASIDTYLSRADAIGEAIPALTTRQITKKH
jgi:hypothetical protein